MSSRETKILFQNQNTVFRNKYAQAISNKFNFVPALVYTISFFFLFYFIYLFINLNKNSAFTNSQV